MTKTITIKKLIEELQKISDIFGDIPVVLSRDEEGNSYSTMDPSNRFYLTCTAVDRGVLILYPYKEYVEIEEIEE